MSLPQSHTAVLERHAPFKGEWATEPYETAWAREAIWFVRIEELPEGAGLEARAQISADGIVWNDEGTRFEPMREKGQWFIRLTHFGGWLRLAGRVSGADDPEVVVTIQLALKS